RRHTRFSRDWSSDVCSSDLIFGVLDKAAPGLAVAKQREGVVQAAGGGACFIAQGVTINANHLEQLGVFRYRRHRFARFRRQPVRSEERRVGKGRSAAVTESG